MKPATALALATIFSLSGCASLHIQQTDSTCTKITKCVARVPVAIVTFGMSEVWHHRERAMESWLGHHESELAMSWGSSSGRAR